MSRTASVQRATGETTVELSLECDGEGAGTRSTGVHFFDHLLDALARHSLMDLELKVAGDLGSGPHHTVEDTGLVLGQALSEALGTRAGIQRYGHSLLPMDEALVECAIDLSGRPLSVFEADYPSNRVGDFDTDLVEEFMRAFTTGAGATLHLCVISGTNTHHMVEATFKAFARALRTAIELDPRSPGIPSTKGLL